MGSERIQSMPRASVASNRGFFYIGKMSPQRQHFIPLCRTLKRRNLTTLTSKALLIKQRPSFICEALQARGVIKQVVSWVKLALSHRIINSLIGDSPREMRVSVDCSPGSYLLLLPWRHVWRRSFTKAGIDRILRSGRC